jgi:hypothetical protein
MILSKMDCCIASEYDGTSSYLELSSYYTRFHQQHFLQRE